MEVRFDHVGIAVRHLSEAVPLWERRLGVRASTPEEVASQKVRVCFLGAGEVQVELLESLDPASAIGKFVERRGEGLHHVAFRVPDLAAQLRELSGAGVRLVDLVPRRGARGHMVAFVHPSSTSGVLTEYLEQTL